MSTPGQLPWAFWILKEDYNTGFYIKTVPGQGHESAEERWDYADGSAIQVLIAMQQGPGFDL